MRRAREFRAVTFSQVLACGLGFGTVLPVMMADSVQGAERLLTLGDFGSPSSPVPDGYADRLLWDDVRSCLVIHYLGRDGLDREDRSDRIVHVEVVQAGHGYGRSHATENDLTVQPVNWSDLVESHQIELLDQMPELDPTQDLTLDMWTIPLVVDEAATEGTGLTVSAILDGRAGAWSYYPVQHPWENPLLAPDALPLTSEDNDLEITYGGSGYLLPASLLASRRSSLVIRLEGDGLGSLGFVPGGDLTKDAFIPWSEEPVTETVRAMDITGDVLNPLFPSPGNWRNFFAHTPATGHSLRGWSLPWAAAEPGQIANILLIPDGIGREEIVVEAGELIPDETRDLISDSDETDVIAPIEDGGQVLLQNQARTQAEQDLADDRVLDAADLEVVSAEDEQDQHGEHVNSNSSHDGSASCRYLESEPTSGIGYEPGVFDIRDADGKLVTGWVIRYETDVDGRIYVNAKGSAKPITGNMTRERVGIDGAAVYQYGWTLERNPAAIIDAGGWTLEPQGAGSGFQCKGIQLFGQLIALPPMSNRTDSIDGYDVESAPEIVIEIERQGQGTILSDRLPEFEIRQPAMGRIVGTLISSEGGGYYRTPGVSPLPEATGEAALLAATHGDDGRRFVTAGDEVAQVHLDGWEAHANGDFNGDGIADLLLHHPETGESAIWNLGSGGSVLMTNGRPMAHSLPTLLPEWKIGGIGSFSLDQPGCCILWRNQFTGQNAIWIIDSSHPNPENWILPDSRFLPTVEDLNWSMVCTNNAACNVGDRLYWMDPSEGSVAQWKIDIQPGASTEEWLTQHEYLCDANGDLITGMDSSWDLIAAGSLAGHPRSDGANAFRDLLFFDRDSGRSAIWLLDGSGSRIDGAAPNGGAGFVTRSGAVIAGDIRQYKPVGIGQYALDGIKWSRDSEHPGRTQWFPTIGWSLPGHGPWFTWQLDRSVDAMRSRQGAVEGTGRSARPFEVNGLR